MTLILPRNPTGEQFEDLLSASLRANGYFTESRVTLRKSKNEVLEIDILATPVGGNAASEKLFEAKKNADLYGTIFKLYGQRMYVGINAACLVSPKAIRPEQVRVCAKLKTETAVEVCHHGLPDSSLDAAAPVHSGLDEGERHNLAIGGWYANIARRLAQDTFVRVVSANKADEPYASARGYFRSVQHSVFIRGSLARVAHLYDAYHEAPNWTGEFIRVLAETEGVDPRAVWSELHDTPQRLWLQFMEALEHSARLAILKNAVQHIASTGSPRIGTQRIVSGDVTIAVPEHHLPERFTDGLRALFEEEWGPRVPYCLQLFIEGFGGILSLTEDRRDAEFLSKASGIPVADIPRALDFYDRVFGLDGWSWFYQTKGELRLLKMVPAFMHGTGTFLRTLLFGLKDYSEQCTDMAWLLNEWHGAGYSILEPVLESVPTAAK